ncbi:ABC transporter [Vibrio albus]|uniref:ABC transporter n=1 Tax=Vibrio albus TaxID=2200953 RepID=A0A2U3BBE7_9VIBR|nr:ABC transporter permease [Vibrio albus]PWI34122.1 ABC transporter [Vibrio albus]
MSLFSLLQKELRSIFTNQVVMLTVFGGVIFYSFLYPLPYAKQTPTEQDITVVNLDNSAVSRQLERMVNATPQVNIVGRAHSIEQAKQQFVSGQVRGLLVIPRHFYRDLLLGKSPILSYAGDASYFLVYGTIIQGLAQASGTLGAKATVTRMLMDGVPLASAQEQYAQARLNMKPVFNPVIGYVDYVIPGVFVLILQQTLIMGTGLLVGTEKDRNGYWKRTPTMSLLSIRVFIFVAIYYLLAMFYFGFSFDYYHISQLADGWLIVKLLAPFLISSACIGIWLGAILPRRELVTMVVLVSSMPLIFSSGFIWPLEALPKPLIWLSQLFPCTPAIQSFLSVNQMGADFSLILPLWSVMWGQVIVWGAIACYAYRKLQQAKPQ